MHNGTRHYAVDSRDRGMFSGRAARATIKIYDVSNAAIPLITLSNAETIAFRLNVPKERNAIETYLLTFIPANAPPIAPKNDPYKVFNPASAEICIVIFNLL